MILAIFDLQVSRMLPINFQVNWPFGSGKEAKQKEFQDGRYGGDFGLPIRMILAIFDLQVTPMLPTKFRVNCPFCSGEEAKKRFLRWMPSLISGWNNFSYFCSSSHPNASYQVSSQLAFWFRRRRKVDFQNGRPGGHLGFPIDRILTNFDLQVILMLPTKFRVNWPFGSGKEAKNRFSRWRPWRPSWISDWNDFSYF